MLVPLEPPYPPGVDRFLSKWTPPGFDAPPLALFRLLAVHPDLCDRARPMASGLLNHGLLPDADRELLIARVTARLGAEYEWGIHAVVQAPAAGLSPAVLGATVHGEPEDFEDPALIRAADELMDEGCISSEVLEAVSTGRTPSQIVEIVLLCGWYRTLSTLILTAELPLEAWAARFPGHSTP